MMHVTDPQTAPLLGYLRRDTAARRPLQLSLLAALVLHLILLWLIFPTPGTARAVSARKPAPRLIRVRLPPPQQTQPRALRPPLSQRRYLPVPQHIDAIPEPLPHAEPAPPEIDPGLELPEAELLLPSGPPAPLPVGGAVQAPQLLQRVEPVYPRLALTLGREGVVLLEAVIDTRGRVRRIRVLRDPGYGLARSAVEAARQWRFEPGRLNGEPVEVLFTLSVSFRRER